MILVQGRPQWQSHAFTVVAICTPSSDGETECHLLHVYNRTVTRRATRYVRDTVGFTTSTTRIDQTGTRPVPARTVFASLGIRNSSCDRWLGPNTGVLAAEARGNVHCSTVCSVPSADRIVTVFWLPLPSLHQETGVISCVISRESRTGLINPHYALARRNAGYSLVALPH